MKIDRGNLPQTTSPRRRWLGIGLTLAVGLLLARSVTASPPPGYNLVWADEFNDPTLNPTNWTYRYLGVRNSAVNVTNAVTLTNGTLVITTYTQNGTNYTSMISTAGKYAPRYGYLEASIQWSDAPGGWSAFWLQNDTMGVVGNPHTNGTEIDIVEHRAVDSSKNNVASQAATNLHWDGYGTNEQSVGSGLIGSGLNLGFHTYGLAWTPNTQSFYYDGALLYAVTNSTVMDPKSPAVAVSQAPEYIILSSEVNNGGWAGNVPTGGYGSQSASTTKMTVDYVRVYQIPTLLSTATLKVANSPKVYTGTGQAATVSITASNTPGIVQNILTGGQLLQTNAGTYAVTANFVPDNPSYTTLTNLAAGNFTILGVPIITGASQPPGNGAFQLEFSGTSNQTFKILGTNQLNAPLSNWPVLMTGTFGIGGPPATNFTDPASTGTNRQRYYRITSP